MIRLNRSGDNAALGVASHSLFENLFDRRLEPMGAFANALADVGYVASQPSTSYPTTTWKRCLEVARRLHFGELTDDEAYRRLGRETTEGFFSSPIGPIFTEIIPLISMRSFFARLENYTRIGRSDVNLEFLELLEDRFRVRTIDPIGVHQFFFVGALEPVLERKRLKSEWRIDGPATDYVVSARWWK